MSTATTTTFLKDLAERAGKTFVQAASATLAVEFAGSGLSVSNLPTLPVAEKIGAAAAIAGIGAVLSLLTSIVSGLKTNTASLSTAVAESAVTPGSHTTIGAALQLDASAYNASTTPTAADTSAAEAALAAVAADHPLDTTEIVGKPAADPTPTPTDDTATAGATFSSTPEA